MYGAVRKNNSTAYQMTFSHIRLFACPPCKRFKGVLSVALSKRPPSHSIIFTGQQRCLLLFFCMCATEVIASEGLQLPSPVAKQFGARSGARGL